MSSASINQPLLINAGIGAPLTVKGAAGADVFTIASTKNTALTTDAGTVAVTTTTGTVGITTDSGAMSIASTSGTIGITSGSGAISTNSGTAATTIANDVGSIALSAAGALTLTSAAGQNINMNVGAGGSFVISGTVTIPQVLAETPNIPAGGAAVSLTWGDVLGVAQILVQCTGNGAYAGVGGGSNATALFAITKTTGTGTVAANTKAINVLSSTVGSVHGEHIILAWEDGVGVTLAISDASFTVVSPAAVTVFTVN